MIKEVVVSVLMAVSTAALWLTSQQFSSAALNNAYLTALSFTIIYFVFKVLIETIALRGVSSERTRYYVRKVSSFAFLAISILTIVTIWVPDPQALLVAYGLIGAGVAVALQDFIKSLMGGLIILTRGPFHIGDRVQLGDKSGDVVDIGLLYTTLYEIQEWVGADQSTGRLCHVPNSTMLSGTVHNYTKESTFLWDEARIPVTLDSDRKAAERVALRIATDKTRDFQKQAKKEFANVQKTYFVRDRDFAAQAYWTVKENNHVLAIRYVTPARQRRNTHTAITTAIIDKFETSKNIDIGSVSTIQSIE